MREKIVIAMFFAAFGFATQAEAQTVKAEGVDISMGLVPVYELSNQGGCPYLLAAPSPQFYKLSYKKCSGSKPIVIEESLERLRVNDIMRDICNENARLNNGCTVELIVEFPDMTPHFVGNDSIEE